MELLKRFWTEEDGMGTVEIVMIIAALMCVALLFRKRIMQFANDVMNKVFTKGIMEKVFKTDTVKDVGVGG